MGQVWTCGVSLEKAGVGRGSTNQGAADAVCDGGATADQESRLWNPSA